MALTRLELPADINMDVGDPLPQPVQLLLDDAAERIEDFLNHHRDNPIVGFVPSEYESVYRALRWIASGSGSYDLYEPGPRTELRSPGLAGAAFCEWGSGFGVVACLASMVGFDSVGIEISPELITQSRQLADDHHLTVELVQGSYVPDDHLLDEDAFEDSCLMTLEQGRAAYDELGLDPEDFDCIFAYPWPGEDEVVASIFDHYAARGALLLTYHGQDGMMLRRKVR